MSRPATPKAREVDGASPQTQREAQALLETSGSPELARQAVASATGHRAAPGPQNDDFGKRWGFASYLEIFEASKPLGESDDKHWLVTNVGPDQWIVWNDEDLEVVRTHKSLEEAKQQTRAATAKPRKQADAPPVG